MRAPLARLLDRYTLFDEGVEADMLLLPIAGPFRAGGRRGTEVLGATRRIRRIARGCTGSAGEITVVCRLFRGDNAWWRVLAEWSRAPANVSVALCVQEWRARSVLFFAWLTCLVTVNLVEFVLVEEGTLR